MLCEVRPPGKAGSERFWEAMAKAAIKLAGHNAQSSEAPSESRQTIRAMNDIQAREFEQRVMQFGKHQGSTIGFIVECDKQYLELFAHGDEFRKDVGRYLAWYELRGKASVDHRLPAPPPGRPSWM